MRVTVRPGLTPGAFRRRIVIRGPHARDVTYRSVRVFPDVLKVRLGKTTLFGDATASRTPLILEVPAGSQPGNHLGSDHGTLGAIRIETTRHETPELRIPVQFAVEG